MDLKYKFFRELQLRIKSLEDTVTDGQCPDMVAYARTCGIIYGMKMAMQEFDDVLTASIEVQKEME